MQILKSASKEAFRKPVNGLNEVTHQHVSSCDCSLQSCLGRFAFAFEAAVLRGADPGASPMRLVPE
jgi:hypothetical protein